MESEWSPDRTIDSEAIEQPGSACALQILLTASVRLVHRIPRVHTGAEALAVVMANLRPPGAARRPVRTGEVATVQERPPVRPRAGKDVVHVWRVTYTVDFVEPFGDGGLLADLAFGAVKLF